MHNPLEFFAAVRSFRNSLGGVSTWSCASHGDHSRAGAPSSVSTSNSAPALSRCVAALISCPQNNLRVFYSPGSSISSRTRSLWRWVAGLGGPWEAMLSGEQLDKHHSLCDAWQLLEGQIFARAPAAYSMLRAEPTFADGAYSLDGPPGSTLYPGSAGLATTVGRVLAANADVLRRMHEVQLASAQCAGQPAFDAFVRVLHLAEGGKHQGGSTYCASGCDPQGVTTAIGRRNSAEGGGGEPQIANVLTLGELVRHPKKLAKAVSAAVRCIYEHRRSQAASRSRPAGFGRLEQETAPAHARTLLRMADIIDGARKHGTREGSSLTGNGKRNEKSEIRAQQQNDKSLPRHSESSLAKDVQTMRGYCDFKASGDASIIVGVRPAELCPGWCGAAGQGNEVEAQVLPMAVEGGARAGFLPLQNEWPDAKKDYMRGFAYTISVVDVEAKEWHRIPYWWAMERQVAAVATQSLRVHRGR